MKILHIFFVSVILTSCCVQFVRKNDLHSYTRIDYDEFTLKPCDFVGKNIAVDCYYRYSMTFAFKNQQIEVEQSHYSLKDDRWKQVIQVIPHKCLEQRQYPHLQEGLYRIYGEVIMEELLCNKDYPYGGFIKVHRIELIDSY